MCIRDSIIERAVKGMLPKTKLGRAMIKKMFVYAGSDHPHACLLYTSDAADERSSVDLGGRRTIKKNNTLAYVRIHRVIN